MKELWNVPKLAKKWDLKTSWIYQHIHELPHYKLGSLVRFDPQELEQFLIEKARRGPRSD
ncbi:helix-turn-helix domain-containing protein [Acidobacteria bacterium AH-259-D05]|nr:helix-turn-helix domain-containing protein [Acidobacteria bacterium AH-259-D05]